MERSPLVRAALDAAGARWPSMTIEARAFEQHLLDLGVDADAIATHGADLALTFACVARSEDALREVDKELRQQGGVARGRFDIDDQALSEVLQIVRVKLLFGPAPRIATYSAQGPLGAWIRMILVRAVFDHLRQQRDADQALPANDVAGALMALDVAVDGARQLPRLKESLEAAVLALPVEDRLLLKLHYLDGVTLEGLATLTNVHRATVARRIATLRRTLIGDVAGRMGARFGMRPSEFRSIWRCFGDEIHVTLSRLLTA